jgi:hypothetical protein
MKRMKALSERKYFGVPNTAKMKALSAQIVVAA